jgi:hypothetical protein
MSFVDTVGLCDYYSCSLTFALQVLRKFAFGIGFWIVIASLSANLERLDDSVLIDKINRS